MRARSPNAALVVAVLLAVGLPTARADDPAALREKVLKASAPEAKAGAYRAYFGAVGRDGLAALTKDKDDGLALQAAWEVHKKPARRATPDDRRSDDVYDPDELAKFVAFVKERTKAPVPDWWAKAVANVDVFPGMHPAFYGPPKDESPKLSKSDAGPRVPDGATLTKDGNDLVYTASGRSVRFPQGAFDYPFDDCYLAAVGEKRSAVAAPSTGFGFAYRLAGFAGRGGKPTWTADVWASGRTMLAGRGHHYVELVETGGVLYLFGVESHGAYAEAFDLATGACRWRFCSTYWWHWSEAWGKKK